MWGFPKLRWQFENEPGNEAHALHSPIDMLPLTGTREAINFGRLKLFNDHVLDDTESPALASRIHARVGFDHLSRGFWVEDQGTTNGTYINDKRIGDGSRVVLKVNDIISFGGPLRVIQDGVHHINPFRSGGLRPPVPPAQRNHSCMDTYRGGV